VEHPQAQIKSRAEVGDVLPCAFAQIALEDLFELTEADPPAAQSLPVLIFREVRMAAENLCRLFESVAERQVFEGVQRIVVNENRDRALGGQQMRRMFDRLAKLVQKGATAWLNVDDVRLGLGSYEHEMVANIKRFDEPAGAIGR
jgi:hypothetical protein